MATTLRRVEKFIKLRAWMLRELKKNGPALIRAAEKKMSGRALAKAIGCSPAYLCYVKSGRLMVSPKMYLRLATIVKGGLKR